MSRNGNGKVISFGLQKGGVGKTTSVILTAKELSEQCPDLKVLAVDFDPQGNLSESLGVIEDIDEIKGKDIFQCVMGQEKVEDCILQITDNLDLLPAHEDLSALTLHMIRKAVNEEVGNDVFFMLKDILDPLRAEYDYVLIDLPPERGYLAILGLVASDAVIIVMQAEPFPRRAVPRFIETIEEVAAEYNPYLEIAGILCTMADNRTNMSSEVIRSLRMVYGPKVFDTVIKRTVRLAEASLIGQSRRVKEIQESYGAFVEELLERGVIKQ
jgi:chromosome partitioning protein